MVAHVSLEVPILIVIDANAYIKGKGCKKLVLVFPFAVSVKPPASFKLLNVFAT